MVGLIRLILRSIWIAIIVLGVRKAMELFQQGTEDLIERIEDGEAEGLARTLSRLHDALHRRMARQAGSGDAFGEV